MRPARSGSGGPADVAATVQRLSPSDEDRLAREPFTYSPVGATRGSTYPDGFDRLDVTHDVGRGSDAFERAVEALMTWRMHTGAGLRVASSSLRVRENDVALCRLGPLRIPCRVVWVLDEPTRRGFGYGTLPGHPEEGEEAFVVELAEGVVTLTVSAYSRPGLAVTRLAGPAARWAQHVAVRRYAAALRRHT
jgi:uncharacterized protein (UPF0548 family)